MPDYYNCPLCGADLRTRPLYSGYFSTDPLARLAHHVAARHPVKRADGVCRGCPCGFRGKFREVLRHLRGVGDVELHLMLAAIATLGRKME